MWHFRLRKGALPFTGLRTRIFFSLSVMIVFGVLLSSCAPTATAQKPTSRSGGSDATTPVVATPRPTPTLIPPPPQGPVFFDVTPNLTSIVGSNPKQCTPPVLSGIFICTVHIVARSSNHGSLRWVAFTTIANNITFTPSNGTLSPGQNILVNIYIPKTDCKQGVLTFRGPSNTHTITWSCS